MTITSIGYDGTVNEARWATLAPLIGRVPSFATQADWKPTTVAGVDRTVRLAVGTASGWGVADTTDATVDVQLALIGSGSRWDAIVLRRNWAPIGGTTTVEKIQGTSTKAIPTLNATPGVLTDQLIALVQVTAGTQVPTALIDCRVALDGGSYTRDGADLTGIPMGTSAWSALTLKTGNSAATALGGTQTPAVRMHRGRVVMRGSVSLSNGNGFPNNSSLICDASGASAIPATYRPDRTVTLSLACEQRSGYNTVRGQVDNLGNLTVWVPSGVTDLPHWVSLEASWAPSTIY